MTHIGQLDRYLSLQQLTTTTGVAGSAVQSWAEVQKVWAQLLPAGRTDAKESYEADELTATARVYFVIHHRAVTPGAYRLVEGSDVYDIIGVAEEPQGEGQFSRERFLRLHCELKDNTEA